MGAFSTDFPQATHDINRQRQGDELTWRPELGGSPPTSPLPHRVLHQASAFSASDRRLCIRKLCGAVARVSWLVVFYCELTTLIRINALTSGFYYRYSRATSCFNRPRRPTPRRRWSCISPERKSPPVSDYAS